MFESLCADSLQHTHQQPNSPAWMDFRADRVVPRRAHAR
jgi:hypothetical protein